MTRVGVLFERTPDGMWVGTCPSVPGAFAQGRTIAEARRKLRATICALVEVAPSGDLEDLVESEATVARAELIEIELPDRSDEILSQAEIARTAGVTRQAVHRWVSRHDFPSPVDRTPAGPRWRRSDVLRWLASGRRTAGRPSIREAWAPARSGRA
jgi:predicted RNase H-like HicB family nuclease/predicted DNA-binding transcriptional regulator AlpA